MQCQQKCSTPTAFGAVEVLKTTGRLPKEGSPEGQGLLFSGKTDEVKKGTL
jgi:hypothetical protein